MAQVKIVTDSACDLSDEDLENHGISVVPLAIRFGDEELIDRVQLSNEQFWNRLSQTSELPSTAAPPAAAFEETFRSAVSEGATAVVCITLSSKLSATYQAASKAVEALAGEIEVHVVDSLLCTIAQGTLCVHAARLAAEGSGAADIAASTEEMKLRTKLVGTLDTIDNLRRGGRIGAAGAFFASLLSVKPVIQIVEGEVQPESRQRTRRRSLDHLAALVEASRPVENLVVAHAGAPDIDDFLTLVETPGIAIPISQIGPVIGTHGGPRLVAVSFVTSVHE